MPTHPFGSALQPCDAARTTPPHCSCRVVRELVLHETAGVAVVRSGAVPANMIIPENVEAG